MKGIIFDIKKFAIHDGPGIRQTVFLKGCPLKCWWCHNPESRKQGVEKKRNTDCNKEEMTIGWEIEAIDLLQEFLKDKVFYDHSDGGVTFSGGEPTMQMDFLEEVLSLCKENGLHTAIDTCGLLKRKDLDRLIDLTDLFLYDLKHLDDAEHIEHTGASNKQILANLEYLNLKGKEIHLRIPLITGFNDSEDHLHQLAEYILNYESITEVKLLPYHKMGEGKYSKFDIKRTHRTTLVPDTKKLEQAKSIFKQNKIDLEIAS